MDKSNIVNTFSGYIEQLRTTECSQKEKIACFQHIGECIMAPALVAHSNYAAHCTSATNVLLLFCEDLDAVVRMSAEENLNKIFRSLEKTRVNRILLDLYGEIKRNGNQRSLRICLNLFAYYAPQIKEKQVKVYALRLLVCMQTIAQRKETQLCETLCEFVKQFGRHLQHGLADSETCKLFEVFMANIGAECAVKRRCSSQNCISLIENSRNKSLMAKHGLNKVIALLLASDQRSHTVLGALGFLRLLLPLLIRGFNNDECDDDDEYNPDGGSGRAGHRRADSEQYQQQAAVPMECRQIVEVYDYCLHLLAVSNATAQHAILNGALEVINAVLQALDTAPLSDGGSGVARCLLELLLGRNQCRQQQQHDLLRRRKSLKNQIFQLRNYEMTSTTTTTAGTAGAAGDTMTAGGNNKKKTTQTVDTASVAYKFPMDKVADAEVMQQQSQRQRQQQQSVFKENSFGIYIGGVGGGEKVNTAAAITDEAGMQSRQTTGNATMATTTSAVLQRNIRHATARSISECVEDETLLAVVGAGDSAANVDGDDANVDVNDNVENADDDDDDEDDFITFSEINEPQRQATALALASAARAASAKTAGPAATTTTIDVDNLIDAMHGTMAGITGSRPTTTREQIIKMSGQQMENLLAASPTSSSALSLSASDAAAAAAGAAFIPDDDKSSQHLSDIDNESFNSIDFEAEITIGGGARVVGEVAAAQPPIAVALSPSGLAAETNTTQTSASKDTIGSFFNNLISNAATESVSKLFRQASAGKSTPTKATLPDRSDTVSTASLSAADTLSFISTASSSKRADSDVPEEQSVACLRRKRSDGSSVTSAAFDDSFSHTASVTPSTAVLVDTSTRNTTTAADCSSDEGDVLQKDKTATAPTQRIPNVNPFLKESSPLKQTLAGPPLLTLKIGTILEQSIVFYTARFTAARFLLTGLPQGLHGDAAIRVSIKSQSLMVIAQCVRLAPEVLQLPVEITEHELRRLHETSAAGAEAGAQPLNSKSSSLSGSPSHVASRSDSSSNLSHDYEHLDAAAVDVCDFSRKTPFPEMEAAVSSLVSVPGDIVDDSLLLEIKDDHFGKSTCDYLLFSPPLSRSADPVLLSQQVGAVVGPPALPPRAPALSKSEILSTTRAKSNAGFQVTEVPEDAPPAMQPPRPPKRTKSIRKSNAAKVMQQLQSPMPSPAPSAACGASGPATATSKQSLADVLLFYSHIDPILRGGVQLIIGNFVQATGAGPTTTPSWSQQQRLNLQQLLAIVLKGFEDDIHTVVIQALNAFDKIFPHVMAKYLTEPACHYPYLQRRHQQQQHQQYRERNEQQQEQEKEEKEHTSSKETSRKQHEIAGGQQQQHSSTNDVMHPRLAAARTTTASSSWTEEAATTTNCPSRAVSIDNDELIAALLNAPLLQLEMKSNNDRIHPTGSDNPTDPQPTTILDTTVEAAAIDVAVVGDDIGGGGGAAADAGHGSFFLSPKLLLDKLRLCHHNKYWLVQNKYAEVISNLNYVPLRLYYEGSAVIPSAHDNDAADADDDTAVDGDTVDADDIVCSYERIFLDELLQLIGDDDVRVREYAAACVCRYIIQHAKQQQHKQLHQQHRRNEVEQAAELKPKLELEQELEQQRQQQDAKSFTALATYQTNFNLLWDFFDYRIFSGMSLPLRQLFSTSAGVAPPLLDAAAQAAFGAALNSITTSISPTTTAATAAAGGAGGGGGFGLVGGFSLGGIGFGGLFGTATPLLGGIGNGIGAGSGGGGGNGIAAFAAYALQRQICDEEKLLAKVLYRLANKLMALHDKNLQFGVIYTLKLLLRHFNFMDYERAWREFNFNEICMKFSYYNFVTASDLNCQNDLIDVMTKLIAGSYLVTQRPHHLHRCQLDQLLTHTLKIINIYYHLFTNQRPLFIAKPQKPELFINAKELAIMQWMGYFGNDYVYIKLYNILRSANDSYKITINQESGSILISLLRTCLNALSVCIELRAHEPAAASSATSSGPTADGNFPSSAVLKLIEEILQYLGKLINYAPGECIGCLRQLLKYLFGQNYGNRQHDYYATFIRPYFAARNKGHNWQQRRQTQLTPATSANTINSSAAGTWPVGGLGSSARATPTKLVSKAVPSPLKAVPTMSSSSYRRRNSIGIHGSWADVSPGSEASLRDASLGSAADYRLFGELFVSGLNLHSWKSERDSECARHIKLFEPLVIYCLPLFLKSNANVQAPILQLLSQLLDLNVTYSILDSKNVIFDQIINNLDLIESGNARHAHIIIPPIMKFLMQLTQKSDRPLITIPKLISITNNLLANSAVRDCAVLALKSLAYELFFMGVAATPTPTATHPPTAQPSATTGGGVEQRAHFQSPMTVSPVSTPGFGAGSGSYQQQEQQSLRSGALPVEDSIAAVAASAAEALLAQQRELDTQKEVVLGMLEKFIDAGVCQQVLGLLLLRERCAQQMDDLTEAVASAAAVGTGGEAGGGGEVGTVGEVAAGQALTPLSDTMAVYAIVCRALSEGRLRVDDWNGFYVLDAFFRNNGRNVLADSKEFLCLLQLLITKDVTNFCDLSYATIILANVILKTEEIYLVNHIKLYLKNHAPGHDWQHQQQQQQHQHATNFTNDGPSTSSAARAIIATATATASSSCPISEINYFAKVLLEKLLGACDTLIGRLREQRSSRRLRARPEVILYCGLTVRFVRALHDCCCRSRHKDTLQSVFRLMLAESEFTDKYYNLIMLHGTPTGLSSSALVMATSSLEAGEAGLDGCLVALQVEVLKLLSAMKLLPPVTWLQQCRSRDGPAVDWLQRRMLHEICLLHPDAINWKLQQVEQLFDAKFLNILIVDHFEFVGSLCEADDEFCSLWQSVLLQHAHVLHKHSIRLLLRLILRLCCAQPPSSSSHCSLQCLVKFLEILGRFHRLHRHGNRLLQSQVERLARRLSSQTPHDRKALCEGLQHALHNKRQSANRTAAEVAADEGPQPLLLMILNDLNTLHTESPTSTSALAPAPSSTTTPMPATRTSGTMGDSIPEQRIIDEKWLFAQLVKYSSDPASGTPHHLVRILLEIQSENKLHRIFANATFDVARVLPHAIVGSLEATLAAFRSNCIQHNPHIHYLQPNALARVSCAVLMERIGVALRAHPNHNPANKEDNDNVSMGGDAATVGQHVAMPHGARIVDTPLFAVSSGTSGSLLLLDLASAVIGLIECARRIELTALVYIDAKFVERFVRDQLLRPATVAALLQFLALCCRRAAVLLHAGGRPCRTEVPALLRCVDALLRQQLIWDELNHAEGGQLCGLVLELLALLVRKSMQHTNFYRTFMMNSDSEKGECRGGGGGDGRSCASPPAVFIAKLIEMQIDGDLFDGTSGERCDSDVGFAIAADGVTSDFDGNEMLRFLVSIGTSVLRTNQFYAYAVTPYEIIQQQLLQQQQRDIDRSPSKRQPATALGSTAAATASGKLPTIPLESLSDVEVLRKFVKRLSIFGFTRRQQFEEYFMTFLLLINKVYDEHMVDEQEQFQIKSTCLEAILELLITYKTFPIVGNNKLSQFHHTTRWPRINYNGICLKKLHQVQLLISEANVFYHPNLERPLAAVAQHSAADNLIGTRRFGLNQYDLNFVWQQMEAYAQLSPNLHGGNMSDRQLPAAAAAAVTSDGAGPSDDSRDAAKDTASRNFRHFAQQSGVDFKSSSQLIFDVLMQIIEYNHILALPNLVKFCEICESRDQIKWIKDKAFRLQETIPMDDTISHQHLIYLLCKTQATLIPTLGQLQHLYTLIGNYLKSSHVFIRNATLAGLLCLLESCSKTNTTIGKLSEELALLRDLIVGYINRHGIIDESSMQCNDTHTKLVWTLNYSLIEWTSKFVPQCHLLLNTIRAASSFLRKTHNEDLYLCVLHGLERVVVNSSNGNGSPSLNITGAAIGGGFGGAASNTGNGLMTPILRDNIEKLALDLVKLENEKFSIPALKLLLSCMYVGSAKQLETTELSNGIVQDDPEIIAQQTDKIDILLHCIKSSTRDAAWIYGQVLCQIIRDLVPPNEILTKVIKEFLAVNQPHCDVIAMIVHQVFRSAIDSSYLQMLQDWLICSLPTFLGLPEEKAVWGLSVIFLSASINLHLIKLFPVVLGSGTRASATTASTTLGTRTAAAAAAAAVAGDGTSTGVGLGGGVGNGNGNSNGSRAHNKLGQHEIALFVTAAQDFHIKLSSKQRMRFQDAFKKFQQNEIYAKLLHSLH